MRGRDFVTRGRVGAVACLTVLIVAVGCVPTPGSRGPAITGVPVVGSVLRVDRGDWVWAERFTFVWRSCATAALTECDVVGDGGDRYVPVLSDLGRHISVTVRAVNGAGSVDSVADSVGPVVAADGIAGSIEVAGAPAATRDPAIRLVLAATPNASEVRVGDGVDVAGQEWRPAVGELAWTLPAGDGDKVISAQWRSAAGVESAVVSTSVVLDRTGPVIRIDSHTDGQAVSVASGEPFVLGGPVADELSDLGAVVIAASGTDEQFPAEILAGDRWARPAGAPETGTFEYTAVATDALGNMSSASVSLHVEAPGGDDAIVRPGVRVLSEAQRELVSEAASDGSRVEFSGDQRGWLLDATVVVSDPITEVAPDGLLVRVLTVTYNEADNATVIDTEHGSFVDVYARLRSAPVGVTPEPEVPEATGPVDGDGAMRAGAQRLAAEAVADRCDAFGRNRTLTVPMTLPDLNLADTHNVKYKVTQNGVTVEEKLEGSVAASVELGAVAVFDQDIRVDIGFGGIDVERVRMVGGFMICGRVTGTADVSVSRVVQAAKKAGIANPDGTMSLSDLLREWPGLTTNPKKLNGFAVPMPQVPLGPITAVRIGPALTLEAFAEQKVSLEALMTTGFHLGTEFGYDNGAVLTPHVDGEFERVQASGSIEATVGLRGRLGVRITGGVPALGEVFGQADMAKVEVSSTAGLTARWTGNRIDDTMTGLGAIDARLCFSVGGSVGAKLTLGFKVGPVQVSTTLIDLEAVEKHAYDGCPVDYTVSRPTGNLAITSPESATATALESWEHQLTSSAEPTTVTWSVPAGSLPPGVLLSPDGHLRGVPTEVGTFAVTVAAVDGFGRRIEQEFTITVELGAVFEVATGTVRVTNGFEADVQLLTRPATDASWQIVEGTLPDGLHLDPGGRLSGTPNGEGTSTVTVTATYAGRTTAPHDIEIAVGGLPVPEPASTGDDGYFVYQRTGESFFWAVGPDQATPQKVQFNATAVQMPAPNDQFNVSEATWNAGPKYASPFLYGPGVYPFADRYVWTNWYNPELGYYGIWIYDLQERSYTTETPITLWRGFNGEDFGGYWGDSPNHRFTMTLNYPVSSPVGSDSDLASGFIVDKSTSTVEVFDAEQLAAIDAFRDRIFADVPEEIPVEFHPDVGLRITDDGRSVIGQSYRLASTGSVRLYWLDLDTLEITTVDLDPGGDDIDWDSSEPPPPGEYTDYQCDHATAVGAGDVLVTCSVISVVVRADGQIERSAGRAELLKFGPDGTRTVLASRDSTSNGAWWCTMGVFGMSPSREQVMAASGCSGDDGEEALGPQMWRYRLDGSGGASLAPEGWSGSFFTTAWIGETFYDLFFEPI